MKLAHRCTYLSDFSIPVRHLTLISSSAGRLGMRPNFVKITKMFVLIVLIVLVYTKVYFGKDLLLNNMKLH